MENEPKKSRRMDVDEESRSTNPLALGISPLVKQSCYTNFMGGIGTIKSWVIYDSALQR